MKEFAIDRYQQVFLGERSRLHAIAYRMLGSSSDAEDAVQEAWLRLRSTNGADIENPRAWLTTVLSRIALDMIRARKARREEEAVAEDIELVLNREPASDPEQDALMAEAVGIGLMVVLDRLEPAERLAFVLHDIFSFSFAEIASVIGRSDIAARQLASRARRRVRGMGETAEADLARQSRIVEAFSAASRNGSFEDLLAVLDPRAKLQVHAEHGPAGNPSVTQGAIRIARKALLAPTARKRASELMLVENSVGIVVAPLGRIRMVMLFGIAGDRIMQIDVVSDPKRIALMRFGLLNHPPRQT